MSIDVRNMKGDEVSLIVGMWYVGVNFPGDFPHYPPAINWHWGAGEIAQYVGENEFYDDNADNATDMGQYDYIVESHMGKI